MKSKYLIVATLMTVASVFAQKDELKTLKKIYERDTPSASDASDYKTALTKGESVIGNGTDADKLYFDFYKAAAPVLDYNVALTKPENLNNPDLGKKYFTNASLLNYIEKSNKILDFEKANKKLLTEKIEKIGSSFKPMMMNYAISLGKEERYKESSEIIYAVYLLDTKDQEKLYYAAGYAVNGKDYDAALKYYNELIKLNYSGEGTYYYATSTVNDKEDYFGADANAKKDRDDKVKLKLYIKPRDEKIMSKRGEIYKNVAYIYQSKGNNEEAKKVIKEAVKLNPDDTTLMLTEANLYLDSKDYDTYKKLIGEILAKNPTNAELYYNLGVISYNNKNFTESENFYKKAIEIDPKYTNAYLNLAILKLDAEKDIIAKMNKLGNTPAENKKYDELKKQRADLFNNALPYLEKTVELDTTNYDAAKTLLSVYNALEMTDKAKPLKEKLKTMKQ